MKKLLLLSLVLSVHSAWADDSKSMEQKMAEASASPVQAVGGNCAKKIGDTVRAKYRISKKKQFWGATYSDFTPDVFIADFGKPDDDCHYFYDVKIKPTHTTPGKNEMNEPTQKAVSCDILEVTPDDNPMDCG